MTTIAWDGHTLVADRQMTTSGVRYETIKAHRLKNGSLFASCGSVDLNAAVRSWLDGECDRPVIDKDDDFDGLVIRPDRTAWTIGKKLVMVRIDSRHFATGSGRDFALAAMAMGCSAKDAVELACTMDIWSGMGITELALETATNSLLHAVSG